MELELLGVLVAVVALLVFALAVNVPYPIALVLGGAALGFLPGAPNVELPPDLVLLIMLPPLLYSAAFFSSLRDLEANIRPISLLAVGCVLFTMLAVALGAHEAVGLSWPVSFTLGAIVAPTDAVAATAIAGRVGAPRRFVTVIEGESLINDSTALICYVFAVEAVTTGSFSLTSAAGHFVVNSVVGVAIGVGVGFLATQLRRRIGDVQVQSALSLTTPYIAYMPAEALHVSAILAVVSCGIYLGWNSPRIITPDARLQLFAVWSLLQFLLNAALFTLVGLQLPRVLDALGGESPGQLAWWSVAITGTVILARLVWVFVSNWMPKVVRLHVQGERGFPGIAMSFIVGWAGMRGAVSLAAALALPTDFEDRDLLVFLTYAVIFGTLVVQGLSLPWLIRALRLDGDDTDGQKEAKARLKAAQAALDRIEQLTDEEWVREDTADRLRRMYEYRRNRFAARFAEDGAESESIEARSVDYQRLLREVLEAQRAEIVQLRNEGRINDEIMHRIERDLDLEDLRLEV